MKDTKIINLLAGFDFDLYFNATTSDIDRTNLRNDFILDSFKNTFPEASNCSREDMLTLLSVDKSIKTWYQNINKAFFNATEVPSYYILAELTPDEQIKVDLELKNIKEILKSYGDKLFQISQEADKKFKTALDERDKRLSLVSDLASVAFITIENVPYNRKIGLLNIKNVNERRQHYKELVKNFQMECIDKIRSNNGKWPEGTKPF